MRGDRDNLSLIQDSNKKVPVAKDESYFLENKMQGRNPCRSDHWTERRRSLDGLGPVRQML